MIRKDQIMEKWTPQFNGYKKACPVCKVEFVGRKNKVYCGKRCKTKYNNGLQLDRRDAERLITEPLLRNIEILREELAQHNSFPITVSSEKLRIKGFDHHAPRTSFVDSQSGKTWFRFGDYAICPDEQKQLVAITKISRNG
jgi:hypothetical protein